MIAVVTHVCDINTRLWCVYEMHVAVSMGVSVKLCAYIHFVSLRRGLVHEDTCVASAKCSVNSSAARCGKPGQPQSKDEIRIRKVIENSVNGFNGVNESVEIIRLSYLAKFPIKDVWKDDRLGAIRKIKEAIECIIPRVNVGNDLKIYDQYLQSEKLNDDIRSVYANFKAW